MTEQTVRPTTSDEIGGTFITSEIVRAGASNGPFDAAKDVGFAYLPVWPSVSKVDPYPSASFLVRP